MEILLKKQAKDFMTKKVIAVREDEPIKHLFTLMDKHGILGVPVVDDGGRVAGIVTESDLLKHFTTLRPPRAINLLGGLAYLDDVSEFNRHLKGHCAERVGELMTRSVVTVHESDSLQTVINRMSEKKVNRLPVVDYGNYLTGIVTRSDVLHELARLKTV